MFLQIAMEINYKKTANHIHTNILAVVNRFSVKANVS